MLADHSACTFDAQPYTLDPPRPLDALDVAQLSAFELHYDDASVLCLDYPSELEDGGLTYRFNGCYFISQYAADIPPLRFICGEGINRVSFVPVPLPEMLSSRNEREALEWLQTALLCDFLQLPKSTALCNMAGAVLPEKCAPEHCAAGFHMLPRFEVELRGSNH